MNIDKFAASSRSQAGQPAVAINATRQPPVAESNPASNSDQVDMSMIGRLMARSVRALADDEEVRPEVLDQHRNLPRQNARFDNSTIDRIFSRLQG